MNKLSLSAFAAGLILLISGAQYVFADSTSLNTVTSTSWNWKVGVTPFLAFVGEVRHWSHVAGYTTGTITANHCPAGWQAFVHVYPPSNSGDTGQDLDITQNYHVCLWNPTAFAPAAVGAQCSTSNNCKFPYWAVRMHGTLQVGTMKDTSVTTQLRTNDDGSGSAGWTLGSYDAGGSGTIYKGLTPNFYLRRVQTHDTWGNPAPFSVMNPVSSVNNNQLWAVNIDPRGFSTYLVFFTYEEWCYPPNPDPLTPYSSIPSNSWGYPWCN